MTDAEFLNELSRRAAVSMAPTLSNDEWLRLDELTGGSRFAGRVPAGSNLWAVSPSALRQEVVRAQAKIAAQVKARISG